VHKFSPVPEYGPGVRFSRKTAGKKKRKGKKKQNGVLVNCETAAALPEKAEETSAAFKGKRWAENKLH